MHDGAGADSDIQGDREVQIAGTMNLDKCSTTAMEPLRNKIEGSVDDQVQYRVLYLFSGPRRPDDGFEQACMELGMKCTCVDVEYNPKQGRTPRHLDLLGEQLEHRYGLGRNFMRSRGFLNSHTGGRVAPPCLCWMNLFSLLVKMM